VPICDCPSTSVFGEAMDACVGLNSSPVSGGSSQVASSFGANYSPTLGCRMVILSTGIIGGSVEPGTDLGSSGPPGDEATLTLSLDVPAWSSSFSFDFNFMSAEYPEWVGSAYNDTFEANLTSGAFNGNVSFDSAGNAININNLLFTVTSSTILAGTGFEGGVGGGTGWLTTTAPVIPGETITLEFSIYDVADGIYDSTVLIDNFQWSVDVVSNPETQQ